MLHGHGFINFSFDLALTHADWVSILHKIRHIQGIEHAGFVHEHSTIREVSAMGYIRLSAQADCKALFEQVKAVPGIVKASLVEPPPSSTTPHPPQPHP